MGPQSAGRSPPSGFRITGREDLTAGCGLRTAAVAFPFRSAKRARPVGMRLMECSAERYRRPFSRPGFSSQT